MLNKTYRIFASIVLVLLLASCETMGPTNNETTTSGYTGLENQDFANAADMMVKDILDSGLLQRKDGARWVVTVSDIINDTSQRIDTDQLTKKIRSSLLKSGKFIVTTAVGVNGPEDRATATVRQLKKSKMINQKTVKKDGRVIAPDLSLSGKIIQRSFAVKGRQTSEYYIQLTLTNLDDGLAYWENEYPFSKQGTNKTVSW